MAIARDTSIALQTLSSTGGTYSYTCTGTNLLLLVWVFVQYASAYTGKTCTVTYDGVSMTELGNTGTTSASDVQGVRLFGLLSPSTGANNVIVTAESSAGVCYSMAASYTGVKQTGLPDSVSSNKGNTGDLSVSTTVVASNCWLFSCSYAERAQTYTSGSMTAIQGNSSQLIMGDSNGTVASGSQAINIHLATANLVGAMIISFAPPVSGPANLKTYNTNAKANIKTINTNAIANVKTLNTNA